MEHFDYNKQAWVVNGVYVACGHQNACKCYGKAHAGEAPTTKLQSDANGTFRAN